MKLLGYTPYGMPKNVSFEVNSLRGLYNRGPVWGFPDTGCLGKKLTGCQCWKLNFDSAGHSGE